MILFIDIDGTIREYTQGITATAVDAMRTAGKNHTLILCTGRTTGMIPYDVPMELFHGIIAGGGAYVSYGDKILKDVSIPRDTVAKYRRFFEENDIPYDAETKLGAFFTPRMGTIVQNILFGGSSAQVLNSPGLKTERIQTKQPIETVDRLGLEVSKLGFCLTPAQYEHFTVPEEDKLTFIHFGDDSDDGYEHCELVREGCDKGASVTQLLRYLDIPRENAYAFGDSSNDITMMKACGTSVSMGNASDDVKQQASFVTDHILEGGFRNALVRLGLIDG